MGTPRTNNWRTDPVLFDLVRLEIPSGNISENIECYWRKSRNPSNSRDNSELSEQVTGKVGSVTNKRGFSNRAGKPLHRNALKQVVHRVRLKEDLFYTLKPDRDQVR